MLQMHSTLFEFLSDYYYCYQEQPDSHLTIAIENGPNGHYGYDMAIS